METVKFAKDWSHHTVPVTTDYKAGTELPVPNEVAEAARAAGVLEGGKASAPTPLTKG